MSAEKKGANMAICGTERSSERAAVERFGSGGMALLPWTKQMLTVLWEQLRLLLQVIYYTFMSVFQMFRLEVHVRITDETGQHIQHMNAAASQTDSFLFSSLFDGENGVMVGGSNPLSNFCSDGGETFAGKSTAEALLSSLRADDICCGLVDDFVSRTTGKDDIFHQSSWKVGDWNIFLSSSDSSNDGCRKEKIFKQEKVVKQDTSEEERSFHWSSEEEQNVVEFDSEEGRALWESLSTSSDPYNPFFFSACISTNTNMGKSQSEAKDRAADGVSVSQANEEMLAPRALNIWVSRSDSESSWSSWAGSEGSSPDFDKEESERLLDFFSCPDDPYNPLSFTACTVTNTSSKTTDTSTTSKPLSDTDAEEKTSSFPPSSEEDDEEQLLWKSLCQTDDPYHPLNFQACLQSLPASPPTTSSKCEKEARTPKKFKPAERRIRHHSHPVQRVVPWKRPGQKPSSTPEEREGVQASPAHKKVQFSPLVQVHVMHTWLFARQASRKGPWEEMARDRDRFRRRIYETEQAIGHCFTLAHRERMRAYVDGAFK